MLEWCVKVSSQHACSCAVPRDKDKVSRTLQPFICLDLIVLRSIYHANNWADTAQPKPRQRKRCVRGIWIGLFESRQYEIEVHDGLQRECFSIPRSTADLPCPQCPHLRPLDFTLPTCSSKTTSTALPSFRTAFPFALSSAFGAILSRL